MKSTSAPGQREVKEDELLPSGRQIEIQHEDQRLVVTEVGAGLRTYCKGEWEILDGYPVDTYCQAGRGQLLLPWPNRIRDGRYRFAEKIQQLALTEPPRGHAIHGLTRYSTWTVDEVGADWCSLSYLLYPQPGYDFTLALAAEFRLGPQGLTVTVTATNLGQEELPYGAGAHPYLRLDEGGVDGWLLQVPAQATMENDDRAIPTGRLLSVAGTQFDFTSPRPIGQVQLDTCFTELQRGPDGLAWVELTSPDGQRRLKMWLNQDHPFVMLFTGDSLAPAERRRGLGVEPMTAAPNAFQNLLGLRVIKPGETVHTAWGIVPVG